MHSDSQAVEPRGSRAVFAVGYLGLGDGFDHETHSLQPGPKLNDLKQYVLRHVRVPLTQLKPFDTAVERGIRHLLRLPQSTTAQFMYSPTSCGGLGLLPLGDPHAALQAAHAFQMLRSKDPAIGAIAREQIVQISRARHALDPTQWVREERRTELVQRSMDGTLGDSAHAPVKLKSGDIASLWTDVRHNLHAWGLRLETRDVNGNTTPLQLGVPHHSKWLDHTTVLRHVKLHLKLGHYTEWTKMAAQGRTARAHCVTGATFVSTGGGLSDAEYRFAWQARLDVVGTNAFLARIKQRGSKTCRRQGCTRAETGGIRQSLKRWAIFSIDSCGSESIPHIQNNQILEEQVPSSREVTWPWTAKPCWWVVGTLFGVGD